MIDCDLCVLIHQIMINLYHFLLKIKMNKIFLINFIHHHKKLYRYQQAIFFIMSSCHHAPLSYHHINPIDHKKPITGITPMIGKKHQLISVLGLLSL